ncbi:hypothetical protein HUJ05_007591 [Dendroctonus ponderosae]|nr:hypothetical protein HUJ05_007591 [Dendroctonus ponderosae]
MVCQSIVLYGAPAWSSKAFLNINKTRLNTTQRNCSKSVFSVLHGFRPASKCRCRTYTATPYGRRKKNDLRTWLLKSISKFSGNESSEHDKKNGKLARKIGPKLLYRMFALGLKGNGWLNQFKYEKIDKITIDMDTQTSLKKTELSGKIPAHTRETSTDGKMKITQAEEPLNRGNLVDETSVTETGQICPTCKRKYGKSKDTQIQTEQPIYFEECGHNRCNSLNDIDSYARWLKIAPKNWADELFENTEIISENPLSTKASTVKVVLVEPADKQMEMSIQLLYKNRYPELVETEESFAVLEHSSRWKLKQDTTACQKVIKIMQGEQKSDLWDRFTQLREESRGDEWVAIHHIERCSSERLRKMAEAIFHKGPTKVAIYTNRKSRTTQERNSERRKHTETSSTQLKPN